MSNTAGSIVTAAGLAFMLLAVSAAVGSGDSNILLISLVGVLVGANLVLLGVHMGSAGSQTTPIVAAFFASAEFLRRNLAVVGLIMASLAVSAVAGKTGPAVLCYAMLALLQLGLCLITAAVLGGVSGLGRTRAREPDEALS